MNNSIKALALLLFFFITPIASATEEPSDKNFSIAYSGASFYRVLPDSDHEANIAEIPFKQTYKEGRGRGFRLSLWDDNQSYSLSYLNGTHEEKTTFINASSELLLLEFGKLVNFYQLEQMSLYAGAEIGIGGFFIRPDIGSDDEGLALSIRLFTGTIIAKRFKLELSAMHFGAGHPGETVMKGNIILFDSGILF